ncbi:hypothetical protein [Photorhabdus hindustanensis]|uniref:hypothetical protein n=1 Tax=Photorhabdus hindustanensis TaxID=2918802 RepID=UPI0011B08686|nr:hypothetical protein [Photorhabdus hindustanensis]
MASMEKYVSRLGSTLVLNTLISLDWCKYKNLIKAENTNKKNIYPMDFKMHRDGKGENPREHSELCDQGE